MGLNPSPVLNIAATVDNKDVILGGEVGFDPLLFSPNTPLGKVRFSSQGWSWQPEDVADGVSELTPTRLLVVKVKNLSRLDTLALCLLERMILFDPKQRPTAEELTLQGCGNRKGGEYVFI
ncbi:hypothetical protein Tco_0089078 [Tanacetum coccineum]